jgi:hypothetical protein
MLRAWRTAMYLRGGEGHDKASITSCKSYSPRELRNVIIKIRDAEMAEGKPKRKLSPVSRYLLDELICKYFKIDAPKGHVLEMIVIEDNKYYGI